MGIWGNFWQAVTLPKLQLTSEVAGAVQRLQSKGRLVVCDPSFKLFDVGKLRLPRNFLQHTDEFARSLDAMAEQIVPTKVTGHTTSIGTQLFPNGNGGFMILPTTHSHDIRTPLFVNCRGVVIDEVLPDTSSGLYVPVAYYGRENLALGKK